MTDDTDPDVELSGTRNPETYKTPESVIDIATQPSLIKRRINERVVDKHGIPLSLLFLFVVMYSLVGFLTMLLFSPLSIFGYISLTTGVVILAIIYFDAGVITIESESDALLYGGTALVFLIVGMRYLLIGPVFPSPI